MQDYSEKEQQGQKEFPNVLCEERKGARNSVLQFAVKVGAGGQALTNKISNQGEVCGGMQGRPSLWARPHPAKPPASEGALGFYAPGKPGVGKGAAPVGQVGKPIPKLALDGQRTLE